MSSEKQIAANRLNAQKSTGPKTPDGKRRSSLNALKHGLSAKTVVLPDENPQDYWYFLIDGIIKLRPEGYFELVLAQRAVNCFWRLARIPRIEAALMSSVPMQALWRHHSELFARLTRYETALQRSALKCIAELKKLQSHRTSRTHMGWPPDVIAQIHATLNNAGEPPANATEQPDNGQPAVPEQAETPGQPGNEQPAVREQREQAETSEHAGGGGSTICEEAEERSNIRRPHRRSGSPVQVMLKRLLDDGLWDAEEPGISPSPLTPSLNSNSLSPGDLPSDLASFCTDPVTSSIPSTPSTPSQEAPAR